MFSLISELERLSPFTPFPARATWRRANDAALQPARVLARTSLYDTGKAFVVTAELPGLGENDVKVELVDDVLTLSGERKLDAPTGEGVTTLHEEQRPVRFERTVTLPVRVDAGSITAAIKNGVLTVTIPKLPEAQPRAISVKAA
jgi:HSP20 family protein